MDSTSIEVEGRTWVLHEGMWCFETDDGLLPAAIEWGAVIPVLLTALHEARQKAEALEELVEWDELSWTLLRNGHYSEEEWAELQRIPWLPPPPEPAPRVSPKDDPLEVPRSFPE